LALRWDNDVLNLDEGWLKVRKTLCRVGNELVFSEPKTDRSRRPENENRCATPRRRRGSSPAR
jgi:hypothetical protein